MSVLGNVDVCAYFVFRSTCYLALLLLTLFIYSFSIPDLSTSGSRKGWSLSQMFTRTLCPRVNIRVIN